MILTLFFIGPSTSSILTFSWLLMIIVLLLTLSYLNKRVNHIMIYPWKVLLSFPYDFPNNTIQTSSFRGLPCPADFFHKLFENKLFLFFARWCHMISTTFECFTMTCCKGFEFSIVICHCALFWKASQIGLKMKKKHAHKSMTHV